MHDVPDVRRQRRWQLGGLAVALGLVAVLAIVVGATRTAPRLRPGAPVPGAVGVARLFAGLPQHGPTLGDPQAPVTLIEFGDLQCPVCAQFARRVLPALVTHQVRNGRLQITFRALDSIGPDSVRGARMALAVGQQDRLWQFIGLFYDNQRDENSGYVTNAFVTALGDAIPGLDAQLALAQRSSAAVDSALASASAEAKRRRLRSTPAFLLGRSGKALRVFMPADLSPGAFSGPIERLAAGR